MTQSPQADAPKTLGKRWAGWACNLLATGLILLAGLVFGRRILQWWGQEPGDAARAVASADRGDQRLGDLQQTHWMQFGDLPGQMSRTTLDGDQDAVLARLANLCEQAARSTPLPSEPPGPAETRMLASIDRQSPTAEVPGKWQVFTLDGPVPMAVSLRFVGVTPPRPQVVGPSRRVVSWGIGLPVSQGRWVLFSYQPTVPLGARSSASGGLQLPPPPEGGSRTVQTAVVGGGTLLGVTGQGSLERWSDWYDRWFASRGWTSAAWQISNTARQNRFDLDGAGSVDVHLSNTIDNRIQGILSLTPSNHSRRNADSDRGEPNR
jgi:hypothetical protein